MKYQDYFTCKKRADGHSYICRRDDLTKEQDKMMQDFIHSVHERLGCGLPNDWIYETIHDCFEDIEDCAATYPLKEPYCYMRCLLDWAKDHYAQYYIGRALREGEYCELFDVLYEGQRMAIEEVFERVNNFIQQSEIEQELEA